MSVEVAAELKRRLKLGVKPVGMEVVDKLWFKVTYSDGWAEPWFFEPGEEKLALAAGRALSDMILEPEKEGAMA